MLNMGGSIVEGTLLVLLNIVKKELGGSSSTEK